LARALGQPVISTSQRIKVIVLFVHRTYSPPAEI
jgi:hypothetical protein